MTIERSPAVLCALLLLLCCASSCEDSASGVGTCEDVCRNFADQCDPLYLAADCVASCEAKVADEISDLLPMDVIDACLGCCAAVDISAETCEMEGEGGVGPEDCDDDALCHDLCDDLF